HAARWVAPNTSRWPKSEEFVCTMIEFSRVRVATKADEVYVARCRLLAFREKQDAETINEADLLCKNDPPSSRNLVVERDGHIVATQAAGSATTLDEPRK